MAHVLVRLKVGDYAVWKKVFEEAGQLRKAYGSKGVRFFRNLEDANEVVILNEYSSSDRARELFQSEEFREATKRAGVSGPPQVTFLDEAGQLPA